MIYDNMTLTVGKTPLIQLNTIGIEYNNKIYVKTESRNPTGSVKCRPALSMITNAINNGQLKKGMKIVEPTSGNTGIALAAMGRALGFDVTIVMPDSMSIERRDIIKGFGAELILTGADRGMPGAIEKAHSLVNEGGFFMPDQFSNPSNPAVHMLTTGPEIDSDTQGLVDVVVAGVGTGGTISGIGNYFRSVKKKPITIIAVEPTESPVISQNLAGQPIKPSKHGIQGIGAGFIPETLDISVLDHVITVSTEEAIDFAKKLMKDEGITCGISGGAALAGSLKAVSKFNYEDKKIVVILPDAGERYLSTALYK